ncbi:MAG: class I SAM-dependent methyltransferase [Microlunatus sp.]|nr:class I SAM-dependent methyltransferase [Microlunatus sp.]MDN5769765.1 class I SAM-dependent methyltransferase [Microlunatus sp.]
MKDFDPLKSFVGEVAEHNDDIPRGDEDETVRLLAELSDGEPALELAVGSGRIAIPLAARGVSVDGIELSDDMIAVLQRRPGGDRVRVFPGDMTIVSTGQTYPLVFLVFNSIFNLLTQDDQVRCFENAARHLTGDGVFLVEAAVPSAWTQRDQYVNAESVQVDHVVLDVCRYDPVTQILDENHVHLDHGGVRLRPISCRLAWPAELDLMARLAGLHLRQRWGGWQRESFDAGSSRHVSLYSRS